MFINRKSHLRIPTMILLVVAISPLTGCVSRSGCPACSGQQTDLDRYKVNEIRVLERNLSSPPQLLFISGGGSHGAWGAGVLAGWSDRDRPEYFDIVTGVSTGALIAPFAFLGKAYDSALETYTKVGSKEIFTRRFILSLPFENSLKSTKPLRRLLDKHVKKEVIDEIGRIFDDTNRRLYVGVVDLDRGEFVVIDLTKMAFHREYKLFRDVLLASSAVAVVFPPVIIPDNGTMYVDGGTRQQVFSKLTLEPFLDSWKTMVGRIVKERGALPQRLTGTPTVYVIVNGKLVVDKQCTKNHLLPIASRAVSILLTEAVRGSLYKIRFLMEKYRPEQGTWEFKLSYIPHDYPLDFPSTKFSKEEMAQLFLEGKKQRDWETEIPTDQVSPLPCN